MKKSRVLNISFIILTVILLVFIVLMNSPVIKQSKYNNPKLDINEIKERGYLVAGVENSSLNYFIYQGQSLGFQYEMLQDFADQLEVELKINEVSSIDTGIHYLLGQQLDILAYDLTVTAERSKIVQFAHPYIQTKMVLVQRKPSNWRKLNRKNLMDSLIRNFNDLAGKTIYVQKGSVFKNRLLSLSEETGIKFSILEHDSLNVESLIQQVSDGTIDFTISDEHVAMVNETYYSNIDIELPISIPKNIAWAIRPDSDSLLIEVNNWMDGYISGRKYATLYQKYFKKPKSAYFRNQEFHSVWGDQISEYDEHIKKYAAGIGWDWRLLASLIYQESRFNPNAKAWTNAFGLMQLMPATAKKLGVDSLSRPDMQIKAGAKYIQWNNKQLPAEITDSLERIHFLLASYNVGLGHVLDARRLAEKYGKNPNVWFNNVDYYLLVKSQSRYFTDEVVKYGYCRGEEPYKFVKEIIARYEQYREVID